MYPLAHPHPSLSQPLYNRNQKQSLLIKKQHNFPYGILWWGNYLHLDNELRRLIISSTDIGRQQKNDKKAKNHASTNADNSNNKTGTVATSNTESNINILKMSGVEDVPILRMGYFKIVEKEPNIASGFKGTTNNHAHAFTIYGR